jgi:hypothetical protein
MAKRTFSNLVTIYIVVTISLFISGSYLVFTKINRENLPRVDFITYLTAAKIIKSNNPQDLYDVNRQFITQAEIIGKNPEDIKSIFLYLYLPFVALLYYPFLSFGAVDAYRLWSVLNILLFLLSGYILGKLVFNDKKRQRISVLTPFMFLPSLMILLQGQPSAILFLVYIALYSALIKKRSLVLGAASGLLLIKTQHVLFAPYLFLMTKNKKHFTAGFVLSTVALLLLSVKLTSLQALIAYPNFILNTNTYGFSVVPDDLFTIFSILEKLAKFLHSGENVPVLFNFVLYFISLLVFREKYAISKNTGKYFMIAVFLSLSFMIRVYMQDLILLLLPMYYLFADKEMKSKKELLIAFFIPWLGLFGLSYIGGVLLLIIALDMMNFNFKRLV